MDKWLIAKNTVGAVFIEEEIASAITETEFNALEIPDYDSATMIALFGRWKRVMRVILAHCRYVLNEPPTVANALVDQEVAAEGAFNYQFAGNSFNSTQTLTYVLVDRPSWVNWNAGTRTFSGTAPVTPGEYFVTVRAVDKQKGYVDDTFKITVT